MSLDDVRSDERRNDTRDRVLDVAARHFADHGFLGASLRAIQREVGVNPATIHYHFGSKEALYQAVIGLFLDRIQAERMAGLAQVPAGLAPRDRLRRLLAAYLAPHIELASSEAGYGYARILAAVQVTIPDAATRLFDDAVAPVRARYVDALQSLFPDVSRRRVYEVLAMAVALMATGTLRLGWQGVDQDRIKAAVDDIVAYAAAGFEHLCGPISDSADGGPVRAALDSFQNQSPD